MSVDDAGFHLYGSIERFLTEIWKAHADRFQFLYGSIESLVL